MAEAKIKHFGIKNGHPNDIYVTNGTLYDGQSPQPFPFT